MRKARALTAIGISAMALAASLATSGASAAPAAPTADRIAVNKILDLGPLGQAVMADTADFAQLSINEKTHTLTVYTATGGHAVARARAALAAAHHASPMLPRGENPALAQTTDYTVVYQPVAHSESQLTAVAKKIEAKGGVDGVKWTSLGIYPMQNQVVVGVAHPTTALRARLAKEYGTTVQLIAASPQAAVGRTRYASKQAAEQAMRAQASTIRPNDTQPYASRQWDQPYWKGGIKIQRKWQKSDGSWWITTCTAGFGWTDPYYAPEQLLTAAHCGPGGVSWYSGDTSRLDRRVGISGWTGFTNNAGTDATLITEVDGHGMSPSIYNGSVSSDTFWPAGGTGFNWPGGAFCSDGSVTGENCSGIIDTCTNVDANYSNGDGHAYNLCISHSSNNSALTHPGDSGGPVVSGNMLQHGIISGETDSSGTHLYFTPWISVSNMIGGHSCPC